MFSLRKRYRVYGSDVRGPERLQRLEFELFPPFAAAAPPFHLVQGLARARLGGRLSRRHAGFADVRCLSATRTQR